MRTTKFSSVLFGVTSRLFVINKIHWCIARQRLLMAGARWRVSAVTYTHRWNVDDTRRPSSDRCQCQILVDCDFCIPHIHPKSPLGGSPSEYCHNVWCGNTIMVWLRDGEKISKIRLLISTEYTNVTDGWQTLHDNIACVYAYHRMAKIVTYDQYLTLSQKICRIGPQLLWKANIETRVRSVKCWHFQWTWVTFEGNLVLLLLCMHSCARSVGDS